MRKIFTVLATALLAADIGSASAATYTFNYAGYNVSNPSNLISSSGTLQISNILNQFGGYDITAISGTVAGETILGLDPKTYVFPNLAPLYSNLSYAYDNTLFVNGSSSGSSDFLSGSGIAFHTSTIDFNFGEGVGTPGADDYLISVALIPGATHAQIYEGTFSVAGLTSAVPEPASWALLILGFGVVGTVLRRQRKPATALRFA